MNTERQYLLQWYDDLTVIKYKLSEMVKHPYLYPKNIRELAIAKTKLQELMFWIDEALGYDNTKEGK